MKAKISDVAKIAGVSPTTVSRVLNNRGYISDETKKNVYKAMKEVNYFPNDIARSLFNKRAPSAALLKACLLLLASLAVLLVLFQYFEWQHAFFLLS